MSKIETIAATLSIKMYVTCPNDECENYINLLDEYDTNGTAHNDEGQLHKQMFPSHGSHDDFECEEVTCTECKTVFNVKTLEWYYE